MSKRYEWAIIGAGPAGIAALGQCLQNNVSPDSIIWIDPEFKVGDFGQLWPNVSSNTKAGLFTRFLEHCPALNTYLPDNNYSLSQQDPELTCDLNHMAVPLQALTDQLLKTIAHEQSTVQQLNRVKSGWALSLNHKTIEANNVVLALGATPKALNMNTQAEQIDLTIALDAQKLAQHINSTDTVGVFGSSHSAIMIIRDALNAGASKVINFYQSPLKYAVDMDDWILYDNTGLKGQTAVWAREHLHAQLPENLSRYHSNPDNIHQYLPLCNKVIYAVGFAPRNISIPGVNTEKYDPRTGIIAPGLFGLGLSHPELRRDPLGNEEYSVGLWKFMTYLDKVMPIWMKYSA